jgi:hypothetical protein
MADDPSFMGGESAEELWEGGYWRLLEYDGVFAF